MAAGALTPPPTNPIRQSACKDILHVPGAADELVSPDVLVPELGERCVTERKDSRRRVPGPRGTVDPESLLLCQVVACTVTTYNQSSSLFRSIPSIGLDGWPATTNNEPENVARQRNKSRKRPWKVHILLRIRKCGPLSTDRCSRRPSWGPASWGKCSGARCRHTAPRGPCSYTSR